MSSSSLFKPDKILPVLWQDNHFAIINKPSGLAVHPGPKTRDSVESRLVPQKRGGPWLAHRLDRDTSGCLLIAKRKTGLIAAQKSFATNKTQKIYWAIVDGIPAGKNGEINNFMRRCTTKSGGWRMELCTPEAEGATKAHSIWRLLGSHQGRSWLELTLHTGRTHQARLHCSSLGTPVLGDTIYNPAPNIQNAYSLQLLARSLRVSLADGRLLQAQAPPEADMAQNLARGFR